MSGLLCARMAYQRLIKIPLMLTSHSRVENTDKYSGLKHSSCSQYINEKHYPLDQVQMLSDHANRESVKKYARVMSEEKRRLIEGKVGDFKD